MAPDQRQQQDQEYVARTDADLPVRVRKDAQLDQNDEEGQRQGEQDEEKYVAGRLPHQRSVL